MNSLMLAGALLTALAFQDATYTTFVQKDGDSIRAQVVSVEGNRVVLKLSVMGGTAEASYKLDEFTPTSAFKILQLQAKGDSFDDHFKLARSAAEYGLIEAAGREAGLAKEAAEKDPKTAEQNLAPLRKWAADALEKVFGEAIAKGDLTKARRYLTTLLTRLPDERTDAQKQALMDMLAKGEEGVRAKREMKERVRADAAEEKARDQALAPIRKDIEAGQALNREGLMSSKTPTAAIGKFEDAVTHYKSAWAATEKILKGPSKDADLRTSATRFAAQIHKEGIEAALNAVNMLVTRSDYSKATDYVNRVLAFDPDNEEAKELRKTIQLASSSGWGWGWGGAR